MSGLQMRRYIGLNVVKRCRLAQLALDPAFPTDSIARQSNRQ